jgi:hypothetical protein
MNRPKIKLNATVNRVLFPPVTQGGDWFVLLTNQGKCVGNMKWRPEEGERLTLEGEWSAYRGERNFKFDGALPNVPVDPHDSLQYVCDRAKGIGPAMADLIWAMRGPKWRETTHGEVPRLTGQRFEAFQEAIALLEIEAEKSQAIAWLMGKGASVTMATAAWDEWEKETIGVVQSNCYRLAELPHYGFTHVDGSVRVAFGIGDSDPRRISAAVIYVLRRLTDWGSTVVDWWEVQGAAVKLVGTHHDSMIVDRVKEMRKDGSLKGFPKSLTLALAEDYRNESSIWEWVNDIA